MFGIKRKEKDPVDEARKKDTKKWIKNHLGGFTPKQSLVSILGSSESLELLTLFEKERKNGATVKDLEVMWANLIEIEPLIAKYVSDGKEGFSKGTEIQRAMKIEKQRDSIRGMGQLMQEGAERVKKEEDDSFTKIEKLYELKEKGIITEEEYEAKKRQLLFE